MERGFEFRVCAAENIEQLIAIGIETYSDTFAVMTGPETMAEYLAAAFDRERIKSEIDNKGATFLFLFVRGELAGYLKVNENEAQTDLREARGLEIARKKQKEYIWLGVWEWSGRQQTVSGEAPLFRGVAPPTLRGLFISNRVGTASTCRITRHGDTCQSTSVALVRSA
jgi:hypothetical protein